MNFKQWFIEMSLDTQQLLAAFLAHPDETTLLILADAMEAEGNGNSALLRSNDLFDKKFIDWYGKHTFERPDGQNRQLTVEEMQQLKQWLPFIRKAVYDKNFQVPPGTLRTNLDNENLNYARRAFYNFFKLIVGGTKV